MALLPEQAPILAVIESMEAIYSPELRGYEGFEIRQSQREEFRNTLISPDIGICEDCLRELRDPRDRRYRYPFINCTNCGPRFTIIKEIPYDRAKTSMAGFPMCPDCDREYHDIDNRRYHAQPDCCASCGPRVFYLDETGNELPGDGIGGVHSVTGNHNHFHTGFLTACHRFGNTRTDGVLHAGKTDKNELLFSGFPVARPHGKSQYTQSPGGHFLYGIPDVLFVGGRKRYYFAVKPDVGAAF